MVNPAKVDAKLNIDWGVAAMGGEGLERCFPPTPRAMMKVIKTGIQAILSYLLKEEKLETIANQPSREMHTNSGHRTHKRRLVVISQQ